jgi:hypothetical protein
MRTRWKILIILLVVAVLSAGLSLLTLHVGPVNSLDAYKNSLRAQGEKLDIKEVSPTPAPPEQNGREAAEAAFNSLGSGNIDPPYNMWMIAPGKAMTGWHQTEACGSDFTNSWDDFSAAITVDAPAIDFLRQAAAKPRLDFGLDYQKGPSMSISHLASFKRSAQAVVAATTLDLHNGDTASAVTNLCVLLHLVRANEDENILISHLVRIAMVSIAVSSTWDCLQATNATDAQLASLQNSWADLQFIQPAEKAMLMERAMALVMVDQARASSSYFDSITRGTYVSGGSGPGGAPGGFGGSLDQVRESFGKTLWRASWSYSQELNFLRSDQIILETLRAMQTNQLWKTQYDAMQSKLAKIQFAYPGQTLCQKLDIPDFDGLMNIGYAGSVILKTMRIEAARRIVITAIALKRFQLKHGNFPGSLTELTPDILPAVPLDPIDGNPLRYHKNDDGTYLLYSIGDDGVDDGGDVTITGSGKPANFNWQNAHSRDWVWPQPATPAEIKLYWDETAAATK